MLTYCRTQIEEEDTGPSRSSQTQQSESWMLSELQRYTARWPTTDVRAGLSCRQWHVAQRSKMESKYMLLSADLNRSLAY